ncbi:hypothetical protein [Ketobacter sp.]
MNKYIEMFEAAKKDPAKAYKVVKLNVLGLFGGRDYQKFMVLTKSRTGSNLLLSYLNSHPNVYCEGEKFWKLSGRNYKTILQSAYRKQPAYIKAKGFKIFYYHPLDQETCDVWGDLARMEDIRVIHLQRRNVLKSHVSHKIAVANDQWMSTHQGRGAAEKKKVYISVEELRDVFEKTESRAEAANTTFKNHKTITVFYEDFVRDPEVYQQILDFLGMDRLPPRTVLKRQNPEKLPDLVENYSELKAAYKDTRWASMFTD